MRRVKVLAILLVLCAVSLVAQQYVALKTNTFLATGTGTVVRLIGTSAANHKITWNLSSGTLSGCSVKLEQSATGTGGWSDLIAGQTCTSNGASAFTAGSPNYVRSNVTTFTTATGTPSLSVTYSGYLTLPVVGADTALSNLGTTAINAHLLFDTDNTYDVGSASKAVRNLYYYNLVGLGTTTSIEGPVSSCTVSASSKGRIHFTSTGPSWSYNAGACQLLLLANSTNTFGASGTLDASAATSADAVRLPNIAGAAPTLVGAIATDTTQKTNKIFSNGISGALPRVLYMTNCTTEGNCATQANTGGTGGNIDTASGTAGTSTLIFASKLALPANFFIANKAVEVCGVVDLVTSGSPPNLTLAVQVGSVAVLANTAVAPTSSLTNKGATRCAIIQGTAAAGASTSLEAGFTSGSTLLTTTINGFNAIAQPVTGFATNGALTVQFSALWSANTAGNSVALRQFWVKELN